MNREEKLPTLPPLDECQGPVLPPGLVPVVPRLEADRVVQDQEILQDRAQPLVLLLVLLEPLQHLGLRALGLDRLGVPVVRESIRL